MTADDEADGRADTEWANRLRRRAEQLRAGDAPSPAAPEPAPMGDDDEPPSFAAGTLGGVDDPDDSELLRRWASEDHLETDSPRRNWTPLVVLLVIAAVVALVVVAFQTVLDDDGDDGPLGPAADGPDAPSVLDEDPPDLDDLTAEVTIPPGPAEGLTVADKGVTIVEDRFDAARREGTFAVLIDNPHDDWIAQGVQIDVQFLDAAGTPLGGDSGFVELMLPGQRVAVAALFFDAPTDPVADVGVNVDVARWRETEPIDGGFTTAEVATEEAEFSGLRTTFTLRSSFAEPLTDVGVTVVYRAADGRLVGGSDTFVDLLEPETDTPVEVSLLANIPLDQIAATEIYPTASFTFDADE